MTVTMISKNGNVFDVGMKLLVSVVSLLRFEYWTFYKTLVKNPGTF
jgi:hypothetical protein